MRQPRISAIEADHDVGGLDDGIRLLTHLQAELVDRLVGDRGRHDGAVDVEAHMGGRRPLLDLDDPAPEAVPGADLHAGILRVALYSCNYIAETALARRPQM